MSAGKILLGVLAGVAAGAALGILLAPDKGSVTRKKISRKSDDLTEELGDKFDEFVDGITRKFEEVKEDAARISKKARQKVEEAEAAVSAATK